MAPLYVYPLSKVVVSTLFGVQKTSALDSKIA